MESVVEVIQFYAHSLYLTPNFRMERHNIVATFYFSK